MANCNDNCQPVWRRTKISSEKKVPLILSRAVREPDPLKYPIYIISTEKALESLKV